MEGIGAYFIENNNVSQDDDNNHHREPTTPSTPESMICSKSRTIYTAGKKKGHASNQRSPFIIGLFYL